MFPYELRWREPLECFEPSRVVVGVDEERKVCPELVMVVVVVAFDVQRENDLLDRFLVRFTFFDRAVHALHLTIYPRVVRLCQAVFYPIGIADHVKAMDAQPCRPAITVSWLIGELDAIARQANGFIR